MSERYFDWRHAASDTPDKVDPNRVRRGVGVLAVLGSVLADPPGRRPHGGRA